MAIIQHLIVDEWGAHIGKYSERLKVTRGGKTLVQAPLLHLETLTIAGRGVSLSAETVRECTERGIPIFFVSGSGAPYASLYSSGLTGTVNTRRAQLRAIDSSLGLRLALAFSTGKINNQRNLIRYMAKYRRETDPGLFARLQQAADDILDSIIEIERISQYPEVLSGEATIEDLRGEIMGHEGSAAKKYWSAVRWVLPDLYQPPSEAAFPGRQGRGAKDPLNSALNYAYGILYGHCERCLVLAGLDPYAGFLHADRPGKPSLTLDFIEEFRQPVVDRTVIGMANKKVSFEQDGYGQLTQETRRTLAAKIHERLESTHAYEGKRHPLRAIMQMQARHLAAFLRLERSAYTPYEMSW